jgi:hypothetical protein
MIALLRYQSAILLRSHRWIFPLLTYGVLVAAGAAEGSTPLAEGLDWSAAVLVPAVAVLTRSMLTAEPDAARACVAAATSPVRAQLATLLTALGGGAVLAVAGAVFEVLTDAPLRKGTNGVVAAVEHPGTLLAGLAVALICLLAGSAAGALCNPPLLRHPGVAVLSTIAAVVFALAADVSPANAALRTGGATAHFVRWPSAQTFVGAVGLVVVTWTGSALAAAYRDGRPAGGA